MIVVALAMVVLLALWVLSPLAGRRRGRTPLPDTHRSELLEAKHAVYRSILDLELDHQLGKVAPADYAELRREHEKEALGLLRQLDEPEAASETEAMDLLEREIAAARTRSPGR